MVDGVKNRRFDLALRHIRTRKKQAPVESAGERGNGFRRRHRIRAVGGGALHDAADAEKKRPAHVFHRVFASREDRLAVLERCAVGRNNQYRADPRRYRQDASPSSHIGSPPKWCREQTYDSDTLFRAVSGWNKSGTRPVCSASHTTPIRRDRWPIVTTKT